MRWLWVDEWHRVGARVCESVCDAQSVCCASCLRRRGVCHVAGEMRQSVHRRGPTASALPASDFQIILHGISKATATLASRV